MTNIILANIDPTINIEAREKLIEFALHPYTIIMFHAPLIGAFVGRRLAEKKGNIDSREKYQGRGALIGTLVGLAGVAVIEKFFHMVQYYPD